MLRLSVSDKIIKEILQNRQSMLDSIHTRMEFLADDIVQNDDIINAVSLKSKQLTDLPSGKGGHSDMFKVYENYQKTLQRRDKEYAEAIKTLIAQEERIERVWIAFNALNADEFKILNALYVLRQPYSATEIESELTHPIFEKRRKSGIKNIIRLYDSDLENKYIFENANIENNSSKHTTTKKTDNYQLSLTDIQPQQQGEKKHV